MDDYGEACRMADARIANCDPGRAENAVHIDGVYAASVRMRLRGKKSLEVVRIGTEYREHVTTEDEAEEPNENGSAKGFGMESGNEQTGYWFTTHT